MQTNPAARPSRDGEGGAFRPDLEGLRAVAVVLVLLYHAGFGFSGGYIGVDVFFVLSGFLITGLLLRELRSTGRVSLSAFYARRARRLLPAAALALIVTAVVSAVVLPPLRVGDTAKDIAAAGLYVSNMWFAGQATDYLASDLPPSPVLHFWSLGVEEQFYLFWPALLAIVSGAAFAAGRAAEGARRVGIALVVTFGASLVLAIWLTRVQQPWAFFSLPARAWELALGGLLALPVAARLVPVRWTPLIGWAGLALVLLAGVRLDESTAFPGVAALLPTVGSALVIAAGLPVAAARGVRTHSGPLRGSATDAPIVPVPAPAVLLGLMPVRWIGRISYSLYLWHWPILVLPAAALGPLPAPVRAVLVVVAILVAAASQRFVEDPIRHGRFVGLQPARLLKLAGATTLAVALVAAGAGAVGAVRLGSTGPDVGGNVDDAPVGVVVPATADPTAGSSLEPGDSAAPGTTATPGTDPSPSASARPALVPAPVPADLVPTLADARNDNPVIYDDGCHVDQATVTPKICAYGDTSSRTTVLLFGDSHAAQWFPALERIAREQSLRLVSMTKSGCPAADVDIWNSNFKRVYDECRAWRREVLKWAAAQHPDVVVISDSRNYLLMAAGKPEPLAQHEDLWAVGLRSSLDQLVADGSRVIVLGDTPRMADDPPTCLSNNLADASKCATPSDVAVSTTRLVADEQTAIAAGAEFIDPTAWLCATEPCSPILRRFLIYRDEHHMTATFARALARPLAAATGLDRIGASPP